MAHFAEIDKQNKVVRVLAIPNEFETEGETYLSKTLGLGGVWIQTSYNHKIRGKFAGIGDNYDSKKDVFYSDDPIPGAIVNVEE